MSASPACRSAEANGWEVITDDFLPAPVLGPCHQDAFERIVKVWSTVLPMPGAGCVYLDLHGDGDRAFDDGEGEILRRVRQGIGPDLPLIASSTCMPINARIWSSMLMHDRLSHLSHVDMATPAVPPQNILRLMLRSKARFAKAFRQLRLIPISWQCTNDQPTKGIYEKLAAWRARRCRRCRLRRAFRRRFPGLRSERVRLCKTQADADAARTRSSR